MAPTTSGSFTRPSSGDCGATIGPGGQARIALASQSTVPSGVPVSQTPSRPRSASHSHPATSVCSAFALSPTGTSSSNTIRWRWNPSAMTRASPMARSSGVSRPHADRAPDRAKAARSLRNGPKWVEWAAWAAASARTAASPAPRGTRMCSAPGNHAGKRPTATPSRSSRTSYTMPVDVCAAHAGRATTAGSEVTPAKVIAMFSAVPPRSWTTRSAGSCASCRARTFMSRALAGVTAVPRNRGRTRSHSSRMPGSAR